MFSKWKFTHGFFHYDGVLILAKQQLVHQPHCPHGALQLELKWPCAAAFINTTAHFASTIAHVVKIFVRAVYTITIAVRTFVHDALLLLLLRMAPQLLRKSSAAFSINAQSLSTNAHSPEGICTLTSELRMSTSLSHYHYSVSRQYYCEYLRR